MLRKLFLIVLPSTGLSIHSFEWLAHKGDMVGRSDTRGCIRSPIARKLNVPYNLLLVHILVPLGIHLKWGRPNHS